MRYVIEFDRGGGRWQTSGNTFSADIGRPLRDRRRRHVNEIDYPNLEAAQREATEQQRGSRMTYRARDTQPELAVAQEGVSMEQTASPRAVRIYRRNREWVIDTGGREVPNMRQLRPYLTPGTKDTYTNYYSPLEAVIGGVSPQILTAAISGWYIEHPNGSALVMEEGVSELPDNNAYLAMGDFIYKMVPVRQAGSSKAVRLMREKVRVEIERVREGLRQQAANEAQQVIAQATARAASIRDEAQRELNAVNASPSFPDWTIGQTVRMLSERRIFVLKQLRIPIKEFSHGTLRWKAKEAPPVSVWLWLPVSGNPENVHLFDASSGYLPHISSAFSCMTIGEKIEPIVSLATLDKFAAQVVRVHSVVNLASLLSVNIETWLPEVKAATPDNIKQWLGVYTSVSRQASCDIEHLPSGHETVRGEETWSVR